MEQTCNQAIELHAAKREDQMPVQRPYEKFDAEDRKVYAAWMRRVLAVYGLLALFGIVVVTFNTTPQATSVATSRAGAIALAAP